MTRWKRGTSLVGGAWVIVAAGGLFVTLAAIRVVVLVVEEGTVADAASGAAMTGGLGLLLAYGGYWLANSELHPATYSRIVSWTLGGAGAMLAIMGLLHVSPIGEGIDRPLFAVPFGMALGSLGGLGIGINEAQAITRAREAERAQVKLRRTVEQLEASNERLEQFAYAASHDLQEPLRMVSSYLQLIESRAEDELTDETREFLEFAVDGADRMRAMIDSLLEYSQVTSRGEPLEPTDANAVLDDVLDDFQLRIEETDATVTTDDLPTVTADPDQLAQVFRNLILNALKFSGDEPPQVHVGSNRTDGEWRFSVADEGIGIDPEYHERIFRVFEQVHIDEYGSESGAGGLGLALCVRIVERHGGEIWVDSERGNGATFYFTIPIPENHTEQGSATASHSPPRKSQNTVGTNR